MPGWRRHGHRRRLTAGSGDVHQRAHWAAARTGSDCRGSTPRRAAASRRRARLATRRRSRRSSVALPRRNRAGGCRVTRTAAWRSRCRAVAAPRPHRDSARRDLECRRRRSPRTPRAARPERSAAPRHEPNSCRRRARSKAGRFPRLLVAIVAPQTVRRGRWPSRGRSRRPPRRAAHGIVAGLAAALAARPAPRRAPAAAAAHRARTTSDRPAPSRGTHRRAAFERGRRAGLRCSTSAGGCECRMAPISPASLDSGECAPARHHLVDHRAESEDVGARVHGLAFELLGRHVREGAEESPLHGQWSP